MIDLRTPDDVNVDEKIYIKQKIDFQTILVEILKYFHYLYLYRNHLIFLIIILAMIFPETIGGYIGYILKGFVKGFCDMK
jgi:hypothetical protein